MLGRPVRRERAPVRQVLVRHDPGGRRHDRDAREQRGPRPEDEQEPADRRPDDDAHVGRHAHRRIGRLAALRRDEVGDHRLADRAAERAEHARERERCQPGPLRIRQREEEQRVPDHHPVPDQDHPPAADPVGQVAAGESAQGRENGADEERERQRRLGAELLDGPDRHERPHRRARGAADQGHAEDRAQSRVQVVAPDEAHHVADGAHDAHASHVQESRGAASRTSLSGREGARESRAGRRPGELVSLRRLRLRLRDGLGECRGDLGNHGLLVVGDHVRRARRVLVARRERRGDAAIAEPLEVAADSRGHLVLVALVFHPPG